MGEFNYLIILGILISEFIPLCDPYIIYIYTQQKLKRMLNTFNRELYIDAYSKIGMIDYIKKNFYNTKAYEVGETLYNIKIKQMKMMQYYKTAVNAPKPQDLDRQVAIFTDVDAFYDELKFNVEMVRDFDKLEADKETKVEMGDDVQVLRSMMRERERSGKLSPEERRARQRAYAYRQKKLVVSRSDNPSLHEHFMKEKDVDEDGFASELS